MRKSLMLLAILCSFLINCAKKNSENMPSKSYFPNSIGNKYSFSVVDSVSFTTYTVKVAVIGKTTLSNRLPVTIWTYTYPGIIDTNYVYTNNDTVIFYDHLKTNITNVYHFPLNVGDKWEASFSGDTSSVISNDTISVNGKLYNNAYLIHEQGHQYNYGIFRDQWYVPKIGMIKLNIIEPINGTRQFWKLMNYEIN